MSHPEQPSTVDRLREGVDAVLVPRGFAAGGVGVCDGRRQILWCAAAADLAARFPGLPSSREPLDGWGTRCTDVVVDLAAAGDEWRVTGVGVEGDDLDVVLAGLGLTVAAGRAAALTGSPAQDCFAPLPRLLLELLEGSGAQR
ncbi:hypothetical protein AB2L28_10810 [Kineococcus sp. TBRC 1896]|uniref:Uncharacterized protein n=1 Tax=Kineococcus mangrovi TaxID=1660183 RepID=A0ABV4I218_9ACTN